MRPEILYPIFSSTKKLPGIGPRIAQHIERLAGPNIVDLLWLTPTGTVDRRNSPKIFDAKSGSIVTLVVRIEKHLPNKSRRQPYKIICSDETGKITIIFLKV